MLVKDPDSGQETTLYLFKEYLEELKAHLDRECDHSGETELRIYTASNGAEHCRPQCLICGRAIGQNVPKATVEQSNLVRFDLSLQAKYQEARQQEKDNILRRHLARQNEEDLRHSEEYLAYMKSDTWRAVRAKVIARCGNVCEGCGEHTVEEVHHLTYEHLGTEFLFELLGLCAGCHRRLHTQGDEPPDQIGDDEEFFDEHPCCGCRWQGVYGELGMMCGIHDKPTQFALAVGGGCGPTRQSFEPLR